MAIITKKFLIDADVLIDFQNSDFSVLREVSQFVGNIYSLREIREEVGGLTFEDNYQVGLKKMKRRNML